MNMGKFEQENTTRMLENYRVYIAAKAAAFTTDAKGQADLLKFKEESAAKEASLINQVRVAQINADTERIRSGLQVKTFWQQQLQDIVASNAFSVGLIINTWTSGLANTIVNGGNFIKAAWKSTEVAVVQAALNMAVQWAAKQALMLTTSETVQTAITAFFGLQETARTTIAVAGSKAAAAASAVTLVGVVAVGTATMGVLAAVLEGIVGFMLAVAAAVVAVPIVGQVLAGTLIVGATLAQVSGLAAIAAATAALTAVAGAAASTAAFAEGGIGQFGSGTQATLHGPEAIIPLNQRGAAFMREAFGGGEKVGQIIHTHVYLKGREIALAVSDDQMSALRTMGAL
jgi:hypothetical protein